MALYTTLGSKNIPEGGIRLSRKEALVFQKNIIKKWKSFTDIFFLEYGCFVSSAFTLASSVYVSNMIRSLLNIGSHSRIIPYFLTAGFPAAMSGFCTEKSVTESSLLMSSKCPLCLHLKFGCIQTLFGVIVPAFTSMGLYLSVAHVKNTIAIPCDLNDTKKLLPFCFKLLKPKTLQFQVLVALQIPLVLLLPYLQEKELIKISAVLRNEGSTNLQFDV